MLNFLGIVCAESSISIIVIALHYGSDFFPILRVLPIFILVSIVGLSPLLRETICPLNPIPVRSRHA